MKKYLAILLAATLVFACAGSAFSEGAEASGPSLVEACIVTEVLDWGETVTALRLEYTEEINLDAIEYSNEHPGKMTYQLINDRAIVNLYVNNSGVKDDIQLYGKYVFINLGIDSQDQTKYRDQVVFNTNNRTRDVNLSQFFVFQQEPIVTRAGNVIPPIARIVTSREIRIGVDDYTTFTYVNEETGATIYCQLYIPAGYEAKDTSLAALPLVVHYPSGDYRYEDGGKYLGALFTHPDCLFWSYPEAQAAHSSFVLTVGGPRDDTWGSAYEDSAMEQNYVAAIDEIIANYNVDTSRIYAISLAGGSSAMWYTILGKPDLFAGFISTAYEFYHTFKDVQVGEDTMKEIYDLMPFWMFAGMTDGSGAGCLGSDDTRLKGQRLLDQATNVNAAGYNIDIAYGQEGELMWNGLLRGASAEALATAQLARAAASGSNHLVTLYLPNTILQTMHWSWNATYSNAVVRDWLFQQVNDAPYQPD